MLRSPLQPAWDLTVIPLQPMWDLTVIIIDQNSCGAHIFTCVNIDLVYSF